MLVFFYFIITIQDAPTTMNTQNELNQNVQITNNLLNQSINNQEEINNKMDTIILNQLNNSGNG